MCNVFLIANISTTWILLSITRKVNNVHCIEIWRETRRIVKRARTDPQGICDAQIFQFLFAPISAAADTAFRGNRGRIHYFYSQYIRSQWHLSVCPLVRTIEMKNRTSKSWNSQRIVLRSIETKNQKDQIHFAF